MTREQSTTTTTKKAPTAATGGASSTSAASSNGGAGGAAGEIPTIRWDDANMQTRYANVVQVTGTREEVVLLLGTHQVWHKDVKEVVIPLQERVLLNPYAAKRLNLQLTALLRAYEGRYGALELGTATAGAPEPLPTK